MKVLELLCEPISNGGQEAFVMNVFNNVEDKSIHMDLYTPYYCDNETYREQVRANGGEVFEGGINFQPGGNKLNIITPIRKLIRTQCYDVVHIHSGSVLSLACASYAARKERVKKIIVHSHCTADRHTIKRDAVKLLSTPIINYAATDYCACSQEAGEWKFSKNVCRKYLKVINNGINIDKFAFNPVIREQLRKKLQIDDDAFVIGHVGRFCFQKNQEYIVDIVEHLVESGKNVKVLLIGTGETQEYVKRLVSEKNLQERILFIGNVNNVHEYMQAMDLFLFPSRFEGLGIVAIEAQASGLPVIVSENVPDDVLINDSVVKISLVEKNEWIERVLFLMNKSDNDRASGTAKLVEHGYDIKNTVGELMNIYEC